MADLGGVGTFSFFSTLQCQPKKFRAFWFLERKKNLKSWRSDGVFLMKVNIFDDFRPISSAFFLLAQGVAQVVLIRDSHVSLLEANYLM